MPLNLQKASLFIWLISAPFIIKPGWPTHLSPSLQKCPLSFWWCCYCPLHGCLCQTWHTASTLWWESPANSWLITAPHLNERELKTQKPSLQSYFVSALKIFYCRIYPHFASFYLIGSCPSTKCVVLWNIVVLFWCEQKQWQSKKNHSEIRHIKFNG